MGCLKKMFDAQDPVSPNCAFAPIDKIAGVGGALQGHGWHFFQAHSQPHTIPWDHFLSDVPILLPWNSCTCNPKP